MESPWSRRCAGPWTLILLERDESEKNKGIRIEKYLSVLNR